MGLFGKSFEEKVTEAIDSLNKMNLGVRALKASVAGKVVTLEGTAPSKDVKGRLMQEFNKLVETENTINKIQLAESALPMVVEAVRPPEAAHTAPLEMEGPPPPPAEEEQWYEVVKGDTLSAIAKKYYGSANQYMKIFEANKDILKNPDLIKIGQRLRIPK